MSERYSYFDRSVVVEQRKLCETYEARQDAEGSLRPMKLTKQDKMPKAACDQ